MQAALRLLGSRPAALTAAAGLGAGRAADRLVSLVMEWVVGEIALVDSLPELPVGPVGQRVVLPEATRHVTFDQLCPGPGRTVLATDAGDPAIGARERALECRDLRDRAAVLRARPWSVRAGGVLHLHLDAKPLLELFPRLQGLLEQHSRIYRHDPHGIGRAVADLQQLVDQHRLLLL